MIRFRLYYAKILPIFKMLHGVLHKFQHFSVFFLLKSAPVCSGGQKRDKDPYLMTIFIQARFLCANVNDGKKYSIHIVPQEVELTFRLSAMLKLIN